MNDIYVKYPKTFHLPWSEEITHDDKCFQNIDTFIGQDVVITLKMDGENTSIYNSKIHARSIDSKDHESRHWVKAYAKRFQYRIPNNWRVCGENLFAKHSIFYNDLESYFLAFNIWNENNICFDWELTKNICNNIGIKTVPVIYNGIMPIKEYIFEIFKEFKEKHEGYVIRLKNEFHYNDFSKSVAKFVRKNHVQTNRHWMNSKIIQNGLKK